MLWKLTDQARRLYEVRWPGPQPTITFTGDVMRYVDTTLGFARELQRLPC